MNGQVARRVFNRAEYHRMGEAGIFSEDDRVELLDGEIIEMSPIGSRHAGCVDQLSQLFSRRLGAKAIVRTQSPIVLNDYSEPQPDISLLKPRDDFYRRQHPGPAEVLMVVEVMDRSADDDRARKVPAYAHARIPEVWLVDLGGDVIDVHRSPAGGTYRDVVRYRRGQRLSIASFPGKTFRVAEILG